MAPAREKPRDLREDCIREALAIIAADGIEALSLRDVARRLGVSHQAPYKHFPSREHIMAEVLTRAYAGFARHLDKRQRDPDPHTDMKYLGQSYLEYARKHPLQYKLMFSTSLPDPDQHPDMMAEARHALGILQESIAMLPGKEQGDVNLDALFVWSTMHGLASIMKTKLGQQMGLTDGTMARSSRHILERIGRALTGEAM